MIAQINNSALKVIGLAEVDGYETSLIDPSKSIARFVVGDERPLSSV
jgi:hypothetical protein